MKTEGLQDLLLGDDLVAPREYDLRKPDPNFVVVDDMISTWMAGDPVLYGDRRLSDLRDPEKAEGECSTASSEFEKYLRDQHGLKMYAFALGAEEIHLLENEERFTTPDQWGYSDRIKPGLDEHTATLICSGDHIYMIDFTAAQYGYEDFPMIQELEPDMETWKPLI